MVTGSHFSGNLAAKRYGRNPEKRLQHGEDPFSKPFHAFSSLITMATLKEGRMVDLNDASGKNGGHSRDKLIGHASEDHDLFADPKQRNMLVRILREEGNVHNLEMRVNKKTGDAHTILLSANPITVNDEPCLLTASVDITAREERIDALKESEEKYRMLVENSLQGLAIIQDSHIVFCNNAYAAIAGYSVEELLSFPDAKELIHTDDYAAVLENYREWFNGKSVSPHYEHRIIRKDKAVRWVEIYASLLEYGGKPALQIVDMDITERKRAEAERERLMAAIEQSGETVVITNAAGIVSYVNPVFERTTGYHREEVIGQTLRILKSGQQDASFYHKLWATISSGKNWKGRIVNRRKDGTCFTESATISPVSDAEGRIVNYVAIKRDITEHLRLEDQFRQAQKMEAVGSLAGGIAHDFNNLLTVIKGYTEILTDGFAPDDPKLRDLDQIAKAVQQAASLTMQLLIFSRKQILQPKILNLNEVLAETKNMLRRLIGEDIELVTIAQPGLGLVNADQVQIQQIIMNLTVNARDAMPQGGKLTIETANVDFDENYVREHALAKAGPYIMLAISDNGTGMDSATQSRIFEPFFTTKEKGKGTGLGLSTVFGIVKQSNGFIWVYSEPGNGTSFKVYLPREQAAVAQAAAECRTDFDSRGFETVLVVEDEATVRNLTSRILRARGYTILEASNGKDAMNVARECTGNIHLILTDVVMPGMSGKDLVSRLKDVRPNIKALYVSGYADNAIIRHGMLDSSVAFLQKPFTVESLARKVREVINLC